MIIPKKRGRPPKMATNQLSELEKTRNELRQLMEQIEYKYDEQNESDFKEHYFRMRDEARFREVFINTVLDAPIFETDTNKLRELSSKYSDLINLHSLRGDEAKAVCQKYNIREEPIFFKEIDELDDLDTLPQCAVSQAGIYKNTERKQFLSKKPPLTEFFPGSFEKLPAAKQEVLDSHKSEIFNDEVTYQEQIETVIRLIYDERGNKEAGPTAIGRLFGVSRGTINTHYKRMNLARRPTIGRPGALEEHQVDQMIIHIRSCYESNQSPNVYNLVDYIFCEFQVSINVKTLRSIISRCPSLKTAKGIPMESTRADVEVEIVLEHYRRLDTILLNELVPPQFFFNVDESGFQEFADAIQQSVIVPADCEDEVYYSVNRSVKRATLIGCICMDGTALKPLVVSPNKTVTKELRVHGYNESTCLIVSQECGFINAEIFAFWLEHIFVPEVQRKRQEYDYSGTVVLTMDGCTAHSSDYFLDECTYYNIYPYYEPPGTSDQVQALDLGIFGIQKKIPGSISLKRVLSSVESEIVRIVNSWRKSTTPDNVVSAFNQAGIYIEYTDERTIVRCDASKGRAVRNVEYTNGENVIEGKKTIPIPTF